MTRDPAAIMTALARQFPALKKAPGIDLRIPVESDHPFRRIPTSDSGGKRPPIPVESDHFSRMERNGGRIPGTGGRNQRNPVVKRRRTRRMPGIYHALLQGGASHAQGANWNAQNQGNPSPQT